MLKYENRIVAFIDILGFKEIVSRSFSNPKEINLLFFLLKQLKENEFPQNWDLTLIEIEEDAQKRNIASFDIKDKVNCTCFSDSIVISAVASDENLNEVASTLIANLALIGLRLISWGIVIRGGMTIGSLHHDNKNMILGPAMVEAYELESKVAEMPRIILSQKLLKKLNYPLLTKKNRYPYHQYLKRFSDGVVGFSQIQLIEVIQSSNLVSREHLIELLQMSKATIIKGLDDNLDNSRNFQKYKWLMDEFNNLIILAEGTHSKINDLNSQNIHYSEANQS